MSQVKTPYIEPSSPWMRILYNPYIIPLYRILSMAHIVKGFCLCADSFSKWPREACQAWALWSLCGFVAGAYRLTTYDGVPHVCNIILSNIVLRSIM